MDIPKNAGVINKYVILLIVLLLAILIGYFIYCNIFNNHNKKIYEHLFGKEVIPQGEHMNNPTVVLLKTHTWNDELEKFAIKIKNEISSKLISQGETIPNRIDFFILIHSDDNSVQKKIKDLTLKKYILVFKESDIKNLYKQGFYSMWLSNHWILMWFFKQYRNYQYYWSIEYDVRISGNSLKIWNYPGADDFIYPFEPFRTPEWTWKNHYIGGPLTDDTKWYGYLQLARYSNKFLEYLDKYYEAGENGQDEMITFSLFKRGQTEIGLTGSKDLLHKLIKNSWSVDNSESDKNKKKLEESESKYQTNPNQLLILHPVKY